LARNERRVARQWLLLQNYVRDGLKVIEVGVSIGSLSYRLQQAGAKVLGIEPDPDMAEYASKQRGIHIITGRFEEIDLEEQRFELAVASHVIEHFVSPAAFLTKLRNRLFDGVKLFLETPNILRPKVGPFRVFSAAHNYHFSPMTLRWLLQKCGFEVERLREFRHDSIQAIATAARPREPSIDARHADEVLRAIQDHKRNYHRKLMFITRKIPVVREWWAYRYVDYSW
jgi:2-polyprenyl-3-methyl-5-hydroxy-6-metoxy-1,4-benzoquinol methylase